MCKNSSVFYNTGFIGIKSALFSDCKTLLCSRIKIELKTLLDFLPFVISYGDVIPNLRVVL